LEATAVVCVAGATASKPPLRHCTLQTGLLKSRTTWKRELCGGGGLSFEAATQYDAIIQTSLQLIFQRSFSREKYNAYQ
jgi:hypothetical protein